MKNKIREFWADTKEYISAFITWTIFTIVMFFGFVLIYGMIWFGFGIPSPDWVGWIWGGLAVVSEVLFIWWVANT